MGQGRRCSKSGGLASPLHMRLAVSGAPSPGQAMRHCSLRFLVTKLRVSVRTMLWNLPAQRLACPVAGFNIWGSWSHRDSPAAERVSLFPSGCRGKRPTNTCFLPHRWPVPSCVCSQGPWGQGCSLGAPIGPSASRCCFLPVLQTQGGWAALRHPPGVCKKAPGPRSCCVGPSQWPGLEAHTGHPSGG